MDSSRLVERLSKGDAQALNQLYLLHGPAVLRYLAALLGSKEHAEDLAHTAWCKAIEHSQSLRDPRKFPLWIRRIAHREALKRLKRDRKYQPLTEETPPDDRAPNNPDPHALAIRQEEFVQLAEALAALRPEHRAVLWLAIVDDLTHEEISTVLEIPSGTSRSRLHCALEKLRGILAPGTGEAHP